MFFFFFSSRRRHTRWNCDWSSDVCSSDLIAVEPAGIGDPQQAAALKGIPVLMLYGDFIAQDARWPQIRKNGIDFTDGIARAGGKVEVVDLPAIGIRGNSR